MGGVMISCTVTGGQFITDLPVSVEGGVVERGVSSAVHTVHIGASPDAVGKRKDC